MNAVLTTPGLVLRPFTAAPADVGLLLALDNNPEVMRHLGRPGLTAQRAREEILPRLTRLYHWPPRHAFWVAERHGTPLGWFALRPLDPDEAPVRAAELGYRLLPDTWGRGVGTEGSRALVRAGFTDFGLTLVTARTMVVNTASRRVMRKAGLTRTATFLRDWGERLPGGEHGDVEYALTADAWRGRAFPSRAVTGARGVVRDRQGACGTRFADVTLDFHPADTGLVFENCVPDLHPDHAEAVEAGLRGHLAAGPFARWPARVVLTAAREHPVDSSPAAFRLAAARAVEQAFSEDLALPGARR